MLFRSPDTYNRRFQSVLFLFRFDPQKQSPARINQTNHAATVGHAKLFLAMTCVPPTRAMKINIQPSTLRKVFIVDDAKDF